MLTEQQINENKERFLSIVDKLAEIRKEENWAGLKEFLITSDFFSAPASTMFHANYTGGLCEHSLNVYDTLMQLTMMSYGDSRDNATPYSWDSLAIVSLFHDLSKTNYYMWDSKNVKYYFAPGEAVPRDAKRDSMGAFEWRKEYAWLRRPLKSSFVYGGHEDTSVLLLQQYVWLTREEITAILHHTGVVGTSSFDQQKEFSYCYSSYPLAIHLHLADTYASFVKEKSGITE